MRIYNGGIGIYSYDLMPERWKACFYNEADAAKAYRIYDNYLRGNSYRGGGTGDWIEDDYHFLLSIYANLVQEGNVRHAHLQAPQPAPLKMVLP